MLITILILLLIFAILGVPSGPVPHSYGWAPSGLFTVVIVVLVILALTGRL